MRYPRFSAVLDFPLHFVLEEVIKQFTSPQALRERYVHFGHFYKDFSEAGEYFVTFVDNHDQITRPYRRFMHNAGAAIGRDEVGGRDSPSGRLFAAVL